MRVLLIGGAGYIGGATYDALIDSGEDVTIYDNLLYESRFLKPSKFIYGDIRDTDKLSNLAKGFDVIVFLAALVGDAACQVDVAHTNEINYLAVKNFVDRLDKKQKLIFISTCSVYGAQNDTLNENSSVSPLSAYASTKLLAERCVSDFGGMVFRLGTVYGKGDNYSRIRFDLIVNVLTLKAVVNQKISINGGDQWRPIISVKDVAAYIAEACENYYSDVFILGKENVLLRELGERVARCIPGTQVEYSDISVKDFRNYKVDNAKSLSTFCHKPLHSVESEVDELMNIIKNRRIINPDDPVYHNGSYLNMNKEVLNVR